MNCPFCNGETTLRFNADNKYYVSCDSLQCLVGPADTDKKVAIKNFEKIRFGEEEKKPDDQRFIAAAHALQGLCHGYSKNDDATYNAWISKKAVEIADQMLKELHK